MPSTVRELVWAAKDIRWFGLHISAVHSLAAYLYQSDVRKHENTIQSFAFIIGIRNTHPKDPNSVC